ncbi:GspE/PulE family protein [Cupriavidus malaysiensis]|uniref:AAA+ ATPase domain-containing protein n=1 Tax=Cupriavidus malaysiensis TaxID=367825 RepID=A0ABM6FGW8_9BURK|nr:ATPase, T2SS/T4P/T4SS family [Cupriavidus malaysiensis]AOZ11207.1 hypothetical protein BKK80_35225 [Cupriavidus malaysiensis]
MNKLREGVPAFHSLLIDPVKQRARAHVPKPATRFSSAWRGDDEVVAFLNHIFTEAAALCASDVHFHDRDGWTEVRLRIDGDLKTLYCLDQSASRFIDDHLRAKCSLSPSERQMPLDGRFRFDLGDRMLDVRVSIIGTDAHGDAQSIVCRVIDAGLGNGTIDDIEMPSSTRNALAVALQATEGIVLVVGPTGSGKTTTLYACLGTLDRPEKHLVTAEDPVERRLERANQVIKNPQRNFPTILRAFLRQDFDVCLVGEIRDAETAAIAYQGANTGHLMLSTLHSKTTASTVTRLGDFGIDPYTIGSATLAILAQRLERALCPHCKVEYYPTEGELHTLEHEAGYVIPASYDDGAPFHKCNEAGCEHCRDGRKGRIPIIELLVADDAVRAAIACKDPGAIAEAATLQPQFRALQHAALDWSLAGRLDFHTAMKVGK